MILAVSAIALAQARPAASATKPSDNEGKITSSISDSEKADPMAHTVRGQVLGPDGKPARDATVIWVGTRKPPVPFVPLPRDDDRSGNPHFETLAHGQTDAQGKFELTASFGRDDLIRFNSIESKLVVIAQARGWRRRTWTRARR